MPIPNPIKPMNIISVTQPTPIIRGYSIEIAIIIPGKWKFMRTFYAIILNIINEAGKQIAFYI